MVWKVWRASKMNNQIPDTPLRKPASWRVLAKERGVSFPLGTYPKPPRIPPTCVLDGLYFIGDEFVGCYVVDTGDGLIMIDCTCNSNDHLNYILHDFQALGLDIRNLRYICITHGHFDHYGQCEQLREISGAKILMAEGEYIMARDVIRKGYLPIKAEPDQFLHDGDTLTLGCITLHFYTTPGHTPETTSIIWNVFDEGKPHVAGLFSGCGITGFMNLPMIEQYIESAKRWTKLCEEHQVDTLLSVHPYVINAKEKINLIRNISNSGVSNPFVVGREGCRMYEELLIHRGLKGLRIKKETIERERNNE